MQYTIWKYQVEWGENSIEMPVGSVILPTALMQEDWPMIYAIVDPAPDASMINRRIVVLSTGEHYEFPVNHRYLGTFRFPQGDVGHIFEFTE